ncbi:hypothetical protein Syun_003393 [Stephania yunnanensis]|uniref:Uncharacterized protein n=1 Tax=Stephania yunnanensis TaxID=152371 RepID=A0AAP0Q3U9_9MAGN
MSDLIGQTHTAANNPPTNPQTVIYKPLVYPPKSGSVALTVRRSEDDKPY